MTNPVQVLRDAIAAGEHKQFGHDPGCRVNSGWPEVVAKGCNCSVKEYEDGRAALAQVEALVQAARHAEHKLRIEYRRNPPFGVYSDDESWAEGETLADALAPFKENP